MSALKIFFLLALCLFSPLKPSHAVTPILATSPEAIFLKALSSTHQGEYAEAIRLLNEAKELFSRAGNQDGQYKSAALGFYLTQEQQYLQKKGNVTPANPSWMRVGWMLADMNLSGLWITPSIPSSTYQGLLLFTRKVRDLSTGPGRSIPVWAILDVIPTPRLMPGEEFASGTCHLKGKEPDGGIAALAMMKGHEKSQEFTKIRKAWRLNPQTSKIEELPAEQVACLNEGLGV